METKIELKELIEDLERNKTALEVLFIQIVVYKFNLRIMEDSLIKELSQLNKNEKIILVEALWDSIASDPEQVDLPNHHKSILENRLKTLEEDSANGKSWSEIREKYL